MYSGLPKATVCKSSHPASGQRGRQQDPHTRGPWACRHLHQAPTKKDGFSDSEGRWLLLIHLLKNIWGSSVVTSEKKGSPRQLPHSNFLKGLLASSQRELLQPLLRSRAVRGWNLSVEAGTWQKVPNNHPPPPFTSEGGRNYTLGGEIWDGSATFPEMPQVRPSLSHTEKQSPLRGRQEGRASILSKSGPWEEKFGMASPLFQTEM